MKLPAAVRSSILVHLCGWLVLLLAAGTLPAEEVKVTTTAAPVQPATAATNTPASTAPLALAVAPPGTTLNPQNQMAVQGRFQPVSEGELIERYGASRYLFQKRSSGNALQLINPLAPAAYGNVATPAPNWNWNPQLNPGQAPLPRAFRDEKSHEATGWFLNAQW